MDAWDLMPTPVAQFLAHVALLLPLLLSAAFRFDVQHPSETVSLTCLSGSIHGRQPDVPPGL